MRLTRSERSGPRFSVSESASPATYSITISTPSLSVAVSNTVTTFGWLSNAPSRASRTKRCSTSAGLSACSRLTATWRPKRSSWHRSTEAIPPDPRCLSTR